MPKILNVPKGLISIGRFPDFENYILISIDEQFKFPVIPKDKIQPISYQRFTFGDLEESSDSDDCSCLLFDLEDRDRILEIYRNCLENNIDLLVHCTAGISRSGAIIEVGLLLGFELEHPTHRIPNAYIKSSLLKACMEDEFFLKRLQANVRTKK